MDPHTEDEDEDIVLQPEHAVDMGNTPEQVKRKKKKKRQRRRKKKGERNPVGFQPLVYDPHNRRRQQKLKELQEQNAKDKDENREEPWVDWVDQELGLIITRPSNSQTKMANGLKKVAYKCHSSGGCEVQDICEYMDILSTAKEELKEKHEQVNRRFAIVKSQIRRTRDPKILSRLQAEIMRLDAWQKGVLEDAKVYNMLREVFVATPAYNKCMEFGKRNLIPTASSTEDKTTLVLRPEVDGFDITFQELLEVEKRRQNRRQHSSAAAAAAEMEELSMDTPS